jgi:WhiB family redox-sensing transcriptional regulator
MIYSGDSWRSARACINVNTLTFFPRNRKQRLHALGFCGICLVRGDCLKYALDNSIEFGIYGGKTEDERKIILRQKR